MTTKIDILYCHATGSARVASARPVLGNEGQDTYETKSRVVFLTIEELKANIMAWLTMGHDVTIKTV